MATIPNFPQNLLREHETWHRNMSRGMRSADGAAFLEFHRNFLRKSLEWYKSQRLNLRLVEPWSSIPSEIRSHPRWNRRFQEAENRITTNLRSFNSSDELGRLILTSSLHDAVHVIGADVFNDDDFARIALAPRSTLFYNWHGLIDNWWKQLER